MITLARLKNPDLTAFMINVDANAVKEDLASFGMTRIVSISLPSGNAMVTNPDAMAKALSLAVKEYGMTLVFGLSTAMGKNLLPRMAAILDAPLVMDCTDVDLEKKIAVTSQYSGKTLAKIKATGKICLFGIRARAVEAKPEHADILIDIPVDAQDCGSPDFRVLPYEETQSPGQDDQGISLSDADVIIAGGRGMKDGENFDILFKCAQKLNAAVGASRVAVDSGWVPYSMQVGQTGEKVSPKVYIACGISGSIQHLAGMKTSGLVLAINTDENAAIMSNADYVVKGDLFNIIPEVTKLLEDC